MNYARRPDITEDTGGRNSLKSTKDYIERTPRSKPIERECELHGKYTSETIVIFGRELRTRCPQCQDIEDREEEEREIQYGLKRTGIPDRFIDKSFDNFNEKTDKIASAKTMCERYAKSDKQGRNLLLIGASLSGKTHLACAIIRTVKEKNKLYITLEELLGKIKASYSDRTVDTPTLKSKYIHIDILCIDNMETFNPTAENRKLLFELVNERYNHMKSTVYCTNISRQDFIESIGIGLYNKMIADGAVKELT